SDGPASSSNSSAPSNPSCNASASTQDESNLSKYRKLQFPDLLWQLASDPNFDPIKWTTDGRRLLIEPASLEPLLKHFFVPPSYYHFRRRLNAYRFKMVQYLGSVREYEHEEHAFRRDNYSAAQEVSGNVGCVGLGILFSSNL